MRELTSPDAVPALAEINERLTSILRRYYRDSAISATWAAIEDIPVNLPPADIAVTDHGFKTSIDGVGHGLQRAIILTVLQYLAESNISTNDGIEFEEPQSDIIIAIEEPELYQHPTKQRLFKQVLRGLAGAFNKMSGIRVQVVYTTHSALLVDFPSFSDIRLVRRNLGAETPDVVVSQAKLSDCSQSLARSIGLTDGEAMGEAMLLSRMHVVGSELSEGFFARCVVIVEGISDKAILEAYFGQLGRDPKEEGIVLVHVEGKSKLDRPSVVFTSLGVPNYLIFDNDRKNETKPTEAVKSIASNRQLQILSGVDASAVE